MTFQVGDLVEFIRRGSREVGVIVRDRGPQRMFTIRIPEGPVMYRYGSEISLISSGTIRNASSGALRGLLHTIVHLQSKREPEVKKERAYPPWGYDWNGDNYGDSPKIHPYNKAQAAADRVNDRRHVEWIRYDHNKWPGLEP